MPHTRFFTDQDIVPNRANTYMSISVDGDPTGKITNSHLNWPRVLWPAAGLHSTAEDLANWIIALQRGALLTRRSEEHTSELQSLMRISYAVCCLKKKNQK